MNQADTTRTINGIIFGVGGLGSMIVGLFLIPGVALIFWGIAFAIITLFGAIQLMMIGRDSGSDSADWSSGTSSRPSRTTLSDVEVSRDRGGVYLNLPGGDKKYLTHEAPPPRSSIGIAHEIVTELFDDLNLKK